MDSLILASASPRRKEILESLGFLPAIIETDIDESIFDHLPVEERVLFLALEKARRAETLAPLPPFELFQDFILGADTLVCGSLDDSPAILGKPDSEADARSMISILAGAEHHVYTGLALLRRSDGAVFTARSDSRVTFAPMDAKEIKDYLESGDWHGAAGAYKVQGRAAYYIERIEGSWSGIVGLPIHELYGILRESAFRLP